MCMTCTSSLDVLLIYGLPLAAVVAHNVTYNMLLRARILSNYFRLEMLLLECHKLMVFLTVTGQRDALEHLWEALEWALRNARGPQMCQGEVLFSGCTPF